MLIAFILVLISIGSAFYSGEVNKKLIIADAEYWRNYWNKQKYVAYLQDLKNQEAKWRV